METKEIKTILAYSIIELNISKKDVKGLIATISHFQLEVLPPDIWHAITENINHDDLVIELNHDLELQKNFMQALKQHGNLKNLVFFGQAFNLLDKVAITEAAEVCINNTDQESGKDLLFAANALQHTMKDEALRWAQEAKETAFSVGDPETFLAACNLLEEEPAEKYLLSLIAREVVILTEQHKNKDPGKVVLPECKKCLALLKWLPKEKGERLQKIIFS